MRRELARTVNAMLAGTGVRLVSRHDLYPWQYAPSDAAIAGTRSLPEGAADYLRFDNPRLAELVERYSRCDPAVTSPAVWTEGTLTSSDLSYFRGDNPFVWQLRGLNYNELTYTMSYYALKCGRGSDLLAAFAEDGLFGAQTFEVDGRLVTRDLLDSVREVEFIRTHVGLEGKSILDIGAGYGRLAHRLSETGADLAVYATDGYAPSSFLAEYYLRFRSAERARVVPLDEVETLLNTTKIDLATNVHSFSECTPAAVSWWASRLAKAKVSHLLLVPNGEHFDLTRPSRYNSGADLEATLGESGYRPAVRELRYADPAVQKYGVDPCQIVLFELQ